MPVCRCSVMEKAIFSILILISIVIYAFNIIPVIEKRFKNKDNAKEVVKEVKNEVVNEVPSSVEANELEIVAAITAAISAYTGMSESDFVVRSIVRRK